MALFKKPSSGSKKATRRDPMGTALALLTKASVSPLVERLHLNKPLERAVSTGAQSAFAAMKVANKSMQPIRELVGTKRPSHTAENPLFDLSLSEDQEMFRDTVARFADEMIRPAAAQADENNATNAEIRQQAHELGIPLIGVPESLGGIGDDWSPTTAAIVAEELARGDMGIATAILAPCGVINALTKWGTADQQSRYLLPLVGEKSIAATMAIAEPQPLFNPNQLQTKASTNNKGYVLNGIKSLVPIATEAELLLIAANLDGAGMQLFAVEAGTAGLTIKPEPAMGLRAAGLCRVTLNNVQLEAGAILGSRNEPFSASEFISRLYIASSALAVGNSQAVLDYVVPYIKDRKAFGEPIAQRQSVAFMAANIAIELDGMRLLTWRAASRAEQGLHFQREAYLAQIQCVEKGMEIGSNGVQLLGGHGFVKEHPVERWYRHARGISMLTGGFLI